MEKEAEPEKISILHQFADSLIEIYDGKPFEMVIIIDVGKKQVLLKASRLIL